MIDKKHFQEMKIMQEKTEGKL